MYDEVTMREATESTMGNAAPKAVNGSVSASADALMVLQRELVEVQRILDDVVERSGPAREAIGHLIGSGGKKIRPMLTLLAAGTIHEGDGDFPTGIAAASELVHTASLLHDDVLDEGVQRRGMPTARLVFSNSVSILSGDHCLASAVKLIQSADTGVVLTESLDMIQSLVGGELIQLETKGELTVDENRYRQICELKTASLFVWAARSGARLAGGTDEQIEAFGKMARAMGIGFQMQDDLLDLTGDERFGKRLLDDLREGRMTLPVIIAAQRDPKLVEMLRDLFERKDDADPNSLKEFRAAVLATGADDAVSAEVQGLTDEALAHLELVPDNAFRQLIIDRIEALAGRDV
jgi:octaprenyl-diphosphate synthase